MAAKIAIQNTLNHYAIPLASTIFKNAFNSNSGGSKIINHPSSSSFLLNSPVSANNVSSASSGYSSTSDETSYSNGEGIGAAGKESSAFVVQNNDENATDNGKLMEKTGGVEKVNSSLSLAHIMNWIKNEPTAENFSEVTSRILYAALKWTKSQKNFRSLPGSDQTLLVNESLCELFILQMAESKFLK